jgi:hypothetical protein
MFFARARSLVSRAVRNDGVHAVSYPAVCYGRDSIYLESESIKALRYSKQALELTRTLLEAPASQPEYAPGSARFTTHGDLCEYGLALLDFFPDVPAASASTLILRRFAAPRRIPPGHVGEE